MYVSEYGYVTVPVIPFSLESHLQSRVPLLCCGNFPFGAFQSDTRPPGHLCRQGPVGRFLLPTYTGNSNRSFLPGFSGLLCVVSLCLSGRSVSCFGGREHVFPLDAGVIRHE